MPRKLGKIFTYEEKLALLNCSVLIYQFLIDSQTLKNTIAEVATWFKNNKLLYCQCFTPKQTIIENKMPKVQTELINSLSSAKKIDALETTVKKLQFKTEPMII